MPAPGWHVSILNLYCGGLLVQYIIASDHRGLKLYDKAASENSKSFFSASRAYFVNPLHEEEVKQLIQNIYANQIGSHHVAKNIDGKLHQSDLELIYELAGGYPGLIQGTINHLLRETDWSIPRIQDGPIFRHEDILRRILPALPREAQISELLEEMAHNVERQNPGVQTMLLAIAAAQFDEKAEQAWRREYADHSREDELYMLGLLDINRRGYDPRPASLLAQFVMLRHLVPTLSKIEFALFELCAHSPDVVEYERIYRLLHNEAPDFDEEPDKLKFVANVFSRIRSKCGAQPNGGAFEIENYQGRGYNLKWLVSFYEFYTQREQAFAEKGNERDRKKQPGRKRKSPD